MRIVALASDLMDRSRMTAAIDGISFARDVDACAGADVVIVDLARFGSAVSELRRTLPQARIIGFGPHVDDEAAANARHDGADIVWPRSRFFRDPASAVSEGP